MTVRSAGFDGKVHFLNRDWPIESGQATFDLRYPDLWKNHHSPIRLKKELEPITRFEVEEFPNGFGNGGLVFAAKGSFHGDLLLYILAEVKRSQDREPFGKEPRVVLLPDEVDDVLWPCCEAAGWPPEAVAVVLALEHPVCVIACVVEAVPRHRRPSLAESLIATPSSDSSANPPPHERKSASVPESHRG